MKRNTGGQTAPRAGCGRRPEGLIAPIATGGASISMGAWLAECAHLEAASVIAFRRFERELRMLNAPGEMIAAARRSRTDEIRHARELTMLAARFGSTPPKVEVVGDADALRPMFEIALENAVEGCIRETYGALVAAYQACAALDPELRSVLLRLSRDEARHSALAHDFDRWIEPQLSAQEREVILRAKNVAFGDLRTAAMHAPAEEVARLAGLPRPREARQLLDGLAGDLLTGVAA